jgi:hypothetical protein
MRYNHKQNIRKKKSGKVTTAKKEQKRNIALGEKLILETRSCVHVTQQTETKSARIVPVMLLLENSSINCV